MFVNYERGTYSEGLGSRANPSAIADLKRWLGNSWLALLWQQKVKDANALHSCVYEITTLNCAV